MEELGHFVERLRSDVEVRCGCPVVKHKYNGREYVLRKLQASGKGNFAYIRRVESGEKVPDRCFPIQVERKYAIKAEVDDFAKDPDNNGFHRRPATYYYVIEGNIKSYDQAVKALSRICQVR